MDVHKSGAPKAVARHLRRAQVLEAKYDKGFDGALRSGIRIGPSSNPTRRLHSVIIASLVTAAIERSRVVSAAAQRRCEPQQRLMMQPPSVSKLKARIAMPTTLARATFTRIPGFSALSGRFTPRPRRKALTTPVRGAPECRGCGIALPAAANIVTPQARRAERLRRGKKIATWLFLSRTGKMPDLDSGSRRNRTQLSFLEISSPARMQPSLHRGL
jgi:hypothetical protein